MDPLSIIVSTITLLTAVGAIRKKIKSVHNANDEARAVLDELLDFEGLIRQTKSLIEEYGTKIPNDQLSDLSALLQKAITNFTELETKMHHSVLRLQASGKIKTSKMAWSREASHITGLQNSLKNVTEKLSMLLSNISISCSLQISRNIETVSHAAAAIHALHESFQSQTLQSLARQDAVLEQVLDQLSQIQTGKEQAFGVLRHTSQGSSTYQSRCIRCNFLRARGISHACLACAKLAVGMRYRRQPIIQLDLLDKKLLLPGTYVSKGYRYLENIVLKWREDTVSVFIKVLPYISMPNLELRVREFQPSKAFEPNVITSKYDDDHGWIPNPPVLTMPFAIPYNYYVESGRLELWARESYLWKLRRTQHCPGRSLLALVGLQDIPMLTNHKLVRNAFTFASLSWVATSALSACRGPPQKIRYRFSMGRSGPMISAASAYRQQANCDTYASRGKVRHHEEEEEEEEVLEIYSSDPTFAEDETDGISSCPTAISCQLSLLCYERARELEDEILTGLQKLMIEPSAKNKGLENVLVAYTALTLLMDAYESYAISFQGNNTQYQRCLHLVECLASELHKLLRSANIVRFLKQQANPKHEEALSEFAESLESSILDQETQHFFQRHSWMRAKTTEFREVNFAFQSLLQGYG